MIDLTFVAWEQQSYVCHMTSQLFHPGFLRPHHFFTAWQFFGWIALLFVLY